MAKITQISAYFSKETHTAPILFRVRRWASPSGGIRLPSRSLKTDAAMQGGRDGNV